MSSSFTAVECRGSDGDDEDPDEPSMPLRAVDGMVKSIICMLPIHPSIYYVVTGLVIKNWSLCMLTQPNDDDDDILYSIIL
jgi:hypothetical protein